MPHYFELSPHVGVWEHTIDSFLSGGDEALDAMAGFCEIGPVTLHSLDLSIGSPVDQQRVAHLDEIKALIDVAEADELSDHLAFSRLEGERLHEFVPIWRVGEQLDIAVETVDHIQDHLGVRLAVENVAALFDPGGEMTTCEFLTQLSHRTGCGLLLDITNFTINEANGMGRVADELDALDLEAVTGIHLAGGETQDGFTWDTHGHPLPAGDLVWLERLLPDLSNLRTVIVERDDRLDHGHELVADLQRVAEVGLAAE